METKTQWTQEQMDWYENVFLPWHEKSILNLDKISKSVKSFVSDLSELREKVTELQTDYSQYEKSQLQK